MTTSRVKAPGSRGRPAGPHRRHPEGDGVVHLRQRPATARACSGALRPVARTPRSRSRASTSRAPSAMPGVVSRHGGRGSAGEEPLRPQLRRPARARRRRRFAMSASRSAIVAAESQWAADAAARAVIIDLEPLPPVFDMEQAMLPDRAEASRVRQRPAARPPGGWRPRARFGGRLGRGLLRDRDAGSGAARPRSRAGGPGSRRRYRSLRRHAVASRRPRAGRPLPGSAGRQGAHPPGRRRWSVRVARGHPHAGPRVRPGAPHRPGRQDGYGREESFHGHVHRHPSRIWMRHGATRDGKLCAVIARLLFDGGAYASSSPAVIGNAITLAVGPYVVPNVHVEGTVVYTNNPSCGAMRGLRRAAGVLRPRGADGQTGAGARHGPDRSPPAERGGVGLASSQLVRSSGAAPRSAS